MQQILLVIVLAPLLAAVLAGLFGKWIGRRGAHTVTIAGVAVACGLSFKVLFDLLNGAPVFDGAVYTWLVSDGIHMEVGFLIDRLSALMIVVVTFVSLMVHVYTIGYMHDDPGYTRFFSYISLFTFSMLMLVMSNNLMQLFFGWEAVGLVSYLLIGFWYTRPSAIFANLKAFLRGALDGARSRRVGAASLRRELEERAPRVRGVGAPDHEPALLEPLQHAGERARVDVQELGHLAGGDAGEASDHPDDEALRARDAEPRLHPLGRGLQRVIERPERPQEVEDRPELSHASAISHRIAAICHDPFDLFELRDRHADRQADLAQVAVRARDLEVGDREDRRVPREVPRPARRPGSGLCRFSPVAAGHYRSVAGSCRKHGTGYPGKGLFPPGGHYRQ